VRKSFPIVSPSVNQNGIQTTLGRFKYVAHNRTRLS
jgi:hypothetical protein